MRETIDQYKKLEKIDTSLIDNGAFDRNLRELIAKIKKTATEARGNECNDIERAFELWVTVNEDCNIFRKEFYFNQHIGWAKKKTRKYSFKALVISSLVSSGAGWLLAKSSLLLDLWRFVFG